MKTKDTVIQSPMIHKDWWTSFLNKSHNLTNTIVAKNAFSSEDSDLLSNEILNVMRQLCRLRTNKYGYRAYIDGKLATEEGLNYIFDSPPHKEENVTEYAKRVFPEKEFGMIINGCEKFSDPLSRKLLELLSPLIEEIGIPLTGLSVHTFIGNYGYTPLGIHKDNRGENVIHFHLGPGGKEMYNWADDVYEEIEGKKKNEDKQFDDLIVHAEKFPFEAGDIYFMPWDKYHLGKSHGLSIGVTVWFNNPPKVKLFDSIISSLSKQYMLTGDKPMEVMLPVKDVKGKESFDELFELFNDEEKLFELPFSELFKVLHDDFKLALFSNAGWKTRTISLSDEDLFSINDYMILKGKTVELVKPFRIYYRKSLDESEIIIFARGSKVKFKYNESIERLLDLINTGEKMNTRDLLDTLPSDWPESIGLYILGLLYDKRTIQLTE
ncbi:hypothetical protein HZQ28_07850 [Elizabethkingia anophelis]|nr:hypothetical protein [Elizabethkingia anophelis]MCT3994397.1 hypothetical protein [Elizabethkingia anophelis]MCT3997887.1 hypothetical protein [Elizabethkingia anophelis]MCT4254932.1 hypothetical protein [Elizabethkingia anophelis]